MENHRIPLADLRRMMLDFYTSKPVVLDEDGIKEHVESTIIHRYRVSDRLLDDVQTAIRSASEALPSGEHKAELQLAVAKIDEAVNNILFAAMAHNKKPTVGLPRAIYIGDLSAPTTAPQPRREAPGDHTN